MAELSFPDSQRPYRKDKPREVGCPAISKLLNASKMSIAPI